jgi:hypothetical protein
MRLPAAFRVNMSKQNTDSRVRFGWTYSLDGDPQIIFEKKPKDNFPGACVYPGAFAVAVLPMPFTSAHRRAVIRQFQKNVHPSRLFGKQNER